MTEHRVKPSVKSLINKQKVIPLPVSFSITAKLLNESETKPIDYVE
jgi:hypothetical protein